MQPTRQEHTELKASPVPRMWAPDASSARKPRHRLFRRYPTSAAWPPPSQSPQAKRAFLLQRAQPALSGLIDGSLSSLAPIFSVALATHTPRYAFFAGLATAIGAGVSMSFSEGLSDTGEDTGRGNPRTRRDHRRRNLHRRLSAHAPVPDSLLHDRNRRRDPRRDVRARDARVPAHAILQHELRNLPAQRCTRRCDHRRGERSPWIRRRLSGAELVESHRDGISHVGVSLPDHSGPRSRVLGRACMYARGNR